eukprot:GHVS01086428.1.p1 GENE.GHVS01086428.1~~GHVS01086428.1.p1  ORF type:complete len:151 (+),score=8.79 GHVS01086428.1:267-719(+)
MEARPTREMSRLLKINETAEDVLYHKQHIISLQNQGNTFREGLGVYRKSRPDALTSSTGTSVPEDCNEGSINGRWLAVSNIFVKLQDKVAVEYLTEGRRTVEACCASETTKRRSAARRLVGLDPDVTEIPRGTLNFLLADTRAPQEASVE